MFGFPVAKRPQEGQYKKNLLKAVIFQIKFPKNEYIVDGFKQHRGQLKSKFPITTPISLGTAEVKFQKDKTPIVQTAQSPNYGHEFKTENNDKNLAITEDSLSYIINGQAYQNFGVAFSEIKESFFPILIELGIGEIHRVAIRKINLVEPKNQNLSKLDLFSLAFNPELVHNFNALPGSGSISSGITNVTLENTNKKLNLTYGLLASGAQKEQILLDIDLFLFNLSVDVDSLESTWRDINSEIFNIFGWAISDTMKKQIQSGDAYA